MSKRIYMGVDVGGTKIHAAVFSLNKGYKRLGEAKIDTQAQAPLDEVIQRIESAIMEAARNANLSLKKIKAIGIGVPGTTNIRTGAIQYASNLGWENVPLKERLQTSLKKPVFVDNDVNLGTLAEQQFGAAKDFKDVIGVFWGTGIGGGIIVNDHLVHGHTFTAAELGHLILQKDGEPCGCGNRGCLETFSAKWAITRFIESAVKEGRESVVTFPEPESGRSVLKSKEIRKAWYNEDAVTAEAMDRAIAYLALALANIVNLMNPEAIVLGGGMIEAMEEPLLDRLREAIKYYTVPFADVQLKAALLGDYAVILGAAYFASMQKNKSVKL